MLDVPCPIPGFIRTSVGRFYVDIGADAVTACQQLDSNVGLATLDTQEVGTFMS